MRAFAVAFADIEREVNANVRAYNEWTSTIQGKGPGQVEAEFGHHRAQQERQLQRALALGAPAEAASIIDDYRGALQAFLSAMDRLMQNWRSRGLNPAFGTAADIERFNTLRRRALANFDALLREQGLR